MTKYLTLVAACLLAFTARAALGQDNPVPASAKLEVVILRFVGETQVGAQPFAFLLKTGEKGSLKIETTSAVDLEVQQPCPVPKGAPQAGTQVDAIVVPKADDRFSVELMISERAFAGCRTVNTVSIPVFSNRIIAHSLTLKSGETIPVDLPADGVRNEAIRMAVTLTMK